MSSSEICPRRRKTKQRRRRRWRIALIRFGVPRSLCSLLPRAIPNLDQPFVPFSHPIFPTAALFLASSKFLHPRKIRPSLTSPFFPSIAVPLLAAFAATDFRSVMILVPRQTGRQEDRQAGSFEISDDFISPIICKANAFLAWDHDVRSLAS